MDDLRVAHSRFHSKNHSADELASAAWSESDPQQAQELVQPIGK